MAQGLARFLCHELRSPLNCIALGFDELTPAVSRKDADADTLAICRAQVQNMRSCLDDLTLVVGSGYALTKDAGGEADRHAGAHADIKPPAGRQMLDAVSLARQLHAVAYMTESRRPHAAGSDTQARAAHVEPVEVTVRVSQPACADAARHARTNVSHSSPCCAQIGDSVGRAREMGAAVDAKRLVDMLATVVLTSLARGARIVALEAIVETSAQYDPFAAAPTGLPPGFVVPRTHAEDVCAAGDEELIGVLRLGQTHPSRSDVLKNWDKRKGAAAKRAAPSHWLVMTVTDDAPGRGDQEMAALFRPFENLRLGELHEGAASGSGLSFFVLRRLVGDLGGTAWVASRPAPGTGNLLGCAFPLLALSRALADASLAAAERVKSYRQEHIGVIVQLASARMKGSGTPESEHGGTGGACAPGELDAAHGRGAAVPAESLRSEPDGKDTATTPSPAAPLPSSQPPSAAVAARRHVLIVDDVRSVRTLLRRVTSSLFDDQLDVTEAGDGAEAVKLALEVRPTFILMDRRMPVMDGDQATRELRAKGYNGPIFGVTGDALPTDVSLFIDAGATEVLVKPVNKARLAKSLTEQGILRADPAVAGAARVARPEKPQDASEAVATAAPGPRTLEAAPAPAGAP